MHHTIRSLRRSSTALALLGLTSATALAQTWTGGGDGVSWLQGTNWSSLPVSNPGTFINFANAGALVTNQNLGNPFTLGYLQQNTTGNLTIGGNALNFNNGSQATITLSAVNSFITAPVIFTSATQVFADSLVMSGGVSGPGQFQMGSGLVTLTGAGTWTGGTLLGNNGGGTLRIAAANALSGNVNFGFNYASVLEFAYPAATTFSGTFANGFIPGQIVRQSGPGTLLLNGASPAFFGTMEVVTGATLRSGSTSALGTGTTQVQNGGTLQMAVNNSLSGVINVAATGTLDAAGFQQTTAVTINNSGAMLLPVGSDVMVGGNSNWGATATTTGAGALSLNGFNILMQAGASLAHTGGTHIIAGSVNFSGANVLPDTGLLRVSGGSVSHTGPDTVDSVLVDGGSFSSNSLTTTGNVNLQSGDFYGNNTTINGAFTKTTAGTGVIGGGGSGVTMAGGGTVSAGILTVNGVLSGALVNNATVDVPFFGGVVNGPVTNNATFNLGSGATLNGATLNAGTLAITSGTVNGTVANSGTISSSNSALIAANVSGAGNFTANASTTVLSGVNTYTGGSVTVNSQTDGTTNSIQGAWTITGSALNFNQAVPGTMSGQISGVGGSVVLQGTGLVTLSGNNTFDQGVYLYPGAHLGIGSNTAAGIGGMIQGNASYKLSAIGGARTVANPLLFAPGQTDFTGANNLTFTNATAKTLSGTSEILHSSTATTGIAGTFLGQNTTTINVNAGTLILGAAVNNGFRMDGAINVAAGATLQMISNSPVKLGPTNLNGGTLIAANGVAVPTGLALTANGTIQGRVSSEAGSLIEATGGLIIGDATSFGGFFSNGELREMAQGVTLLDKNQAVLGSLTEVGTTSLPGLLTAANGVFVDFGRAITGYGIVAGNNTLADATIVNGDAAGNSNVQPLDFTGYVKGLGTFTDVTFSGTFSPGLSPAIVPVNNVTFGPASTLLLEIGGLIPGSQHDQLDITGTLGLNGLLDIDLINGFNPAYGDTFNVFDGTTTGTFTSFSFPALGGGLSWDTSALYTAGNLNIVPEPATASLLLLAGLGTLATRRRRIAV